MTKLDDAPSHDPDSGLEDLTELNEALKAGLRRAGMHWMRAGYELVAGLGALLDEIASAGKDGSPPVDDRGPTKIQLD
jgi:hypothetical protein